MEKILTPWSKITSPHSLLNENYHHRVKAIDRRRQVKLQELDNLLENEPMQLPKYTPTEIAKGKVGWKIFIKLNELRP